MIASKRTIRILVASILVLMPRLAYAWDYKVCFRVPVENTDSGFPALTATEEDYYVTDNGEEDYKLRGALAWVVDPNDDTVFLEYTDLNGCAEFSSVYGAGSFDVAVLSIAQSGGGNVVRVHSGGADTSREFPGGHYTHAQAGVPLYSTNFFATNTVDLQIPLDDKAIWSMFATASYSVYRLSQGVSNKTINIGECGTCTSSTSHTGSYGYLGDGTAFVRLNEDHLRWKFLIAHEIGHTLTWLHEGTSTRAVNDPSYDGEWGACEKRGNSYSMYSPEYNNIGFKEGFAHFYATRVFNDRGTSDAAIAWRQTGFWAEHIPDPNDLEGSSGYGNSAEYYYDSSSDVYGGFMQNICGASAPVGISTNYDWLRFYWDFYDDPSCGGTASFGNMIDIYTRVENQSPAPAKDDFYDAVLDATYDEFGGSTCHRNLAGIWADYNGIE